MDWLLILISAGAGVLFALLLPAIRKALFPQKVEAGEALPEEVVESSVLGEVSLREELEFELLRTQVDPHFLFNSLTTLSALIEEDQEAALRFTDSLAAFFRDVVSYRGQPLIALDSELNTLKRYVDVLHQRFGESLLMEILGEEGTEGFLIPPMTLQILCENAVKHNIATLGSPLHLVIQIKAENLEFRNRYQPRPLKRRSTGLGIDNLRRRFEGLEIADRFAAAQQGEEFVVQIPLVQS